MPLPDIGSYLYRTRGYTDEYGHAWQEIDRALVTETGGDVIKTMVFETATFPDHTPPEDWPSLEWEHPPGAEALILTPGSIGGMWKTEQPTLPTDRTELPASTEQDYLQWKADVSFAREAGRPEPELTNESAKIAAIHEHREAMKAWRS